MRILIVSAWYHPFIHPRAHRWTAIAGHWAALGHEVHVLCGRLNGTQRYLHLNGVHVHRVGFDSLKEVFYYFFPGKNALSRPGGGVRSISYFTRVLFFIYRKIWKQIHFPDDACIWYYPALHTAENIVKKHKIEALVSVSFPFTGHLIGLALKKKHPELCWVADTGDPASISEVSLYNRFLYGKAIRRLEKNVLQSADFVSVTTPALKEKYIRFFGPARAEMMVIVPPLHDPPEPELPPAIPEEWRVEKRPGEIHIGYFGALLPRIRTPRAFLNWLDRLRGLQPAIFSRLRVHIVSEILPEFLPELGNRPGIILYGLCTREHTRALIAQMDALVHIGNRTDYQLPSKAVDYLASGLPVIHFSYVKNDPFIRFWGDMPGISSLQVQEEQIMGQENPDWEGFVSPGTWKEDLKKVRRAAAKMYSVETIGGILLGLLQRKTK